MNHPAPHRSQRKHMISPQQHALQQHDEITTQGPLTTLHDKWQHANSDHLTTARYKKFYDEVIYTQG
jgi:hypothetical protein